jgi:hypothetical protein
MAPTKLQPRSRVRSRSFTARSLAIHEHVARTVCTHIFLEILELRNAVMAEVELFQSLQLLQALDLGHPVGLHRQNLQALERAKVLEVRSVQVDPVQANGDLEFGEFVLA